MVVVESAMNGKDIQGFFQFYVMCCDMKKAFDGKVNLARW